MKYRKTSLYQKLLCCSTNSSISALDDMETFRKISKNRYSGVDKPIGKSATACDCVEQCDEDCRNVRLLIECGASCKFGENCLNKRFQQKKYASLSVFDTSDMGKGVRANELINSYQFIIEYVGEVINKDEMIARMNRYNAEKTIHHYMMSLGRGLYIDATKMGNIARFVNHSCSPNCQVQFWDVDGRLCVGIFAKQKIQQGEELTYNYQFVTYGCVQKLFQSSFE